CRLNERSRFGCKSGVTIWLKPFVVANDEGAVERAPIMITMIVRELINSSFALRLCKSFDIFAGSKAVAEELVDSVLNPGGGILRLPIMRVLAIDASLRKTGVAIVDANNGEPRSVYFGTIHNASSLRSSSCLVAIRHRLVELIREHQPDCWALEAGIYVQRR